MRPWYCTREQVKLALDFRETARNNAIVDRAIAGASDMLDSPEVCNRPHGFHPTTATRHFDWPPRGGFGRAWTLELDSEDLISVSSITSEGGDVTLTSSEYLLEPVNLGPPYDRVEIDLSESASFGAGDTHQRAIAITGLWGYRNDQVPAGALDGAINTSVTTVTVTDGSVVGVGSLLTVDTERLLVTGRQLTASAVSTITDDVAKAKATETVPVADGSAFHAGEVITIGAERMRIEDIAGNNLLVSRAWDGSTLAAHTSGADVFASRRLTVERAATGTTAASHSDAAAVTRWVPPDLVTQAAVAEAINTIQQEASGYARRVGLSDKRGPGRLGSQRVGDSGLTSIREQVKRAYRRVRVGSI